MLASRASLFVLVFSTLATVVLGQYETSCTRNSDCTGENQICYKYEQFSPPCKKGICVCKPCYVYFGEKCVIARKTLGEACTGSRTDEAIAVPGASCINKKVACLSDYPLSANGKQCAHDRTCEDGRSCPPKMRCQSGRCACNNAAERFEATRQTCVARELNDACNSDGNCGADADGIYGYSMSGGVCTYTSSGEQKCGCKDYSKAMNITWYDQKNDAIVNKAICTGTEATNINQGRNKVCSLNAVKMTSQPYYLATCLPGFVCFQCPEDIDGSGDETINRNEEGRCRKLNEGISGLKPVCDAAVAKPASAARINITDVEVNVTMNRALPLTTAIPPPSIASSSSLDKVCSWDFDCTSENHETCSDTSEFFPSCKKGRCICDGCYVRSKNRCIKKRYVKSVGSVCNGADEEVITVPFATCLDQKVTCPKNAPAVAGGTQCYPDISCDYGNSTKGCPSKTQCGGDNKCFCSDQGTSWDSNRQACVPLSYNDKCSTSDDCSFPGGTTRVYPYWLSYFGGGYASYVVGGVCTASKCYCPSGYIPASVAVLDPRTNKWGAKTICVGEKATVDATDGAVCSKDPLNAGRGLTVAVCSSSHICVGCPEDNSTDSSTGKCRLINKLAFDTEEDCITSAGTGISAVVATIILLALVSIWRPL